MQVRVRRRYGAPLTHEHRAGRDAATADPRRGVRTAAAATPISKMRHPWSQADGAAPQRTLGDWRRLFAGGFDEQLAARLARDEAVDLHELLVLADRGFPPQLAARILAPLDGGP